ncbi:MAG: hypothetical protein US30_C0004G0067 [Candidatus Moranbacteria bacterium GW2011_GWF2_36_839]|nr:MAG: hypothetical protein US27_C0002G0070 [Candidatus Moranbacteria bacterium GW2011_GWF1_36_78]KKQ17323.1 MAG: hypothetical protein US30_C0004G0067 [Candidatus Moranbacteria bacterium GW2011_GWF2_36_839]
MENKKLAILVSILNKLWKFSWPIIRRAHWEHWVILVLSMFIFIQNFNWIFSGGEISKEKKEVKVERVCGLDSVASLPCRGQLNVDFDILADIDKARLLLEGNEAGFTLGRKELYKFKDCKVQKKVPIKKRKGKFKIVTVKGKCKQTWTVPYLKDYNVLLAVENVNERIIKLIRIPAKGKGLVKGFGIDRGNPNGVNTEFEVTHPEGFIVLGLRRVVQFDGKYKEVVYTPYTKELDIPAIRQRGLEYLQDKILAAKNELASLGVRSHAFSGENVSEVVPTEVSLCLSIIEHIDPARFLRGESSESLTNEVLTIVGANGNLAYRYSISKSKARGLFQFIPKTYRNLKGIYQEARLTPDFIEGMENHFNGAKASLLLFDSDLAYLSPKYREKLRNSPEDMGKYLAAAYNCGSPRAAKSINSGGALPEETRVYLLKFGEIWNLLNR